MMSLLFELSSGFDATEDIIPAQEALGGWKQSVEVINILARLCAL